MGASLSPADKGTGEFSDPILGDSTFAIVPVCMVKGAWRAGFDVVGPESTCPFEVDGGAVRPPDGRVAGVSKAGFETDVKEMFDNELLVIRDGMDVCDGFAGRPVLRFRAFADPFVSFVF